MKDIRKYLAILSGWFASKKIEEKTFIHPDPSPAYVVDVLMMVSPTDWPKMYLAMMERYGPEWARGFEESLIYIAVESARVIGIKRESARGGAGTTSHEERMAFGGWGFACMVAKALGQEAPPAPSGFGRP